MQVKYNENTKESELIGTKLAAAEAEAAAAKPEAAEAAASEEQEQKQVNWVAVNNLTKEQQGMMALGVDLAPGAYKHLSEKLIQRLGTYRLLRAKDLEKEKAAGEAEAAELTITKRKILFVN